MKNCSYKLEMALIFATIFVHTISLICACVSMCTCTRARFKCEDKIYLPQCWPSHIQMKCRDSTARHEFKYNWWKYLNTICFAIVRFVLLFCVWKWNLPRIECARKLWIATVSRSEMAMAKIYEAKESSARSEMDAQNRYIKDTHQLIVLLSKRMVHKSHNMTNGR